MKNRRLVTMCLLLSGCLLFMAPALNGSSTGRPPEGGAAGDGSPYRASVVQVVAFEKRGGALGTGVVVADGVRTCWHVVRDAEQVVVRGHDGSERKAVSWYRTHVDAALICFDDPLDLPCMIETDEIPSGRFEALCVGFWGRSASEAVPVALKGSVFPDEPVDYRGSTSGWLATSIPLMRGLSGSPLIFEGRVIGLAAQRDDDWAHTLFSRLDETPDRP